MTNKFRASWTNLSTWAMGDYEKAIKYYFHLDTYTSPAMLAGRSYHEAWQKEIETNKKLPSVFGSQALKNPICEGKKVVSIEDWLDLVGIIDCRDEDVIYEFKTGKQSSEGYANSYQAGIYSLLCLFDKIEIGKVEIHHFDQYKKKSDMSIIWVTDKLLRDSLDWVITQASEFHNYLLTNDLYKRFTKDGSV
jgi:hypothetical protein